MTSLLALSSMSDLRSYAWLWVSLVACTTAGRSDCTYVSVLQSLVYVCENEKHAVPVFYKGSGIAFPLKTERRRSCSFFLSSSWDLTAVQWYTVVLWRCLAFLSLFCILLKGQRGRGNIVFHWSVHSLLGDCSLAPFVLYIRFFFFYEEKFGKNIRLGAYLASPSMGNFWMLLPTTFSTTRMLRDVLSETSSKEFELKTWIES